MKKTVLGGALALAAASLLAFAPNTASAASGLAYSDVVFNYEEQSMTITADGVLQVSVATATKNDFSKAKWEIYDTLGEEDGVTVDLSKLNKKNDNYIQVKAITGGAVDPLTWYIPAATPTTKGKTGAVILSYDKKHGEVIATGAQEDLKGFEYRVSTASTWTEIDASGDSPDLSAYQRNGATLYFRQKAADPAAAPNPATTDAPAEAKSFAGIEQKITISALAAGPKVTLDYANHAAKIPAGVEYRVATSSATAWCDNEGTVGTSYTANSTGKIELVKLDDDAILQYGGFIEVRKAQITGSANNGSKDALATKVTHIELPELTTVDVSAGTAIEDTATPANKTYDIDQATFDSGKVTVTVDANNVITFKSTSTDSYEYVIVPRYSVSGGQITQDVPEADIKVTGKIGKKATVKCNKMITSKKDYINGKNEKAIYVRKVANTTAKTWSTPWALLGGIPAPTE